MSFRVINNKLPIGKNTLVNVVNTFGANGELVATRVMTTFSTEESALKRLKELDLEVGDDIQIIPVGGQM
jgi:hypothetical protein